MGKWLDLAVQLEAEETPHDKRDASDTCPPSVASVAFVTPPISLPADIAAGLVRLRNMRPPRVQRPELWGEIVRDALRIETEGWAVQAIGLGWDAYAIWGVEPSSDPDQWNEGLAVQLAGRPIRAIDATAFYIQDGDRRILFNRRPRPGLTKYLWDLDGIQSRREKLL